MNEITILDYGYGNLFSISSAITELGYTPVCSKSTELVLKSKIIILPGVGSFKQAMYAIKRLKLDIAIKQALAKGSKLIGICLGYQMLFQESQEFGFCEGLGILKGKVISLNTFNNLNQRIPNVGWRPVIINENNNTIPYYFNKKMFYFVHSFVPLAKDLEKVSTYVEFGNSLLHASVHTSNVAGFQYHPEKSGEAGLNLLKDTIETLLQ